MSKKRSNSGFFMRVNACFSIFSRKTCVNRLKKEKKWSFFSYSQIMIMFTHTISCMKKTTIFSLFFNLFTHVFRLKILKHALTRIKKPEFERFLLTVGNRNYERNTFTFSGFRLFFCAFKRVFEKSCLLG